MPRAKHIAFDDAAVLAAIAEVPGVAEASVAADGADAGELKIVLAPGYDEDEVEAAVATLLREKFALGVDEAATAVVEDADLAPPRAHDAPLSDVQRPTIERMHLVSTGSDVTATVTVGLAGRSEDGEATDSADEAGALRAVATATLRAAEQLADSRAAFRLDRVDIADTGDRTAVVRVTMTRGDVSSSLAGAVVVRDDVRQAVIRATLDAINRRLGLLLAE